MHRRSIPSKRLALLAAAAICALPWLAPGAAARDLTADDKQLLKQYRLSLDTSERCVAAYKDVVAGARSDPALKQEFDKARSKQSDRTLNQIIKAYDSEYPATAAALKKRNCAPRDFVLSTSSMAYAGLVNQLRQQGQATKGFDFVPPENLATYDKNKDRFAALTKELQNVSQGGGAKRRP